MVKPIAIDRNAGGSAVDQVKTKGKQRLDEGNWICIFPEVTRVLLGQKKRYKMGGAILAEYCAQNSPNGAKATPVYPVAHNAGEYCPRHSFIKYPGTITMSIGEPFSVKGMTPWKSMRKLRGG